MKCTNNIEHSLVQGRTLSIQSIHIHSLLKPWHTDHSPICFTYLHKLLCIWHIIQHNLFSNLWFDVTLFAQEHQILQILLVLFSVIIKCHGHIQEVHFTHHILGLASSHKNIKYFKSCLYCSVSSSNAITTFKKYILLITYLALSADQDCCISMS
jgi:hypothetical protein